MAPKLAPKPTPAALSGRVVACRRGTETTTLAVRERICSGGCGGDSWDGADRFRTDMETIHATVSPNPSSTDTLLLTLDEVARHLRCARRSIERHVASHRLHAVHLGRSVRVERRELERFIAQMREPDDA